jgi:L-threonylcarbamoyladenylate synthase
LRHAEKELGDLPDFYLDGGECEIGLESTIIGFFDGKPTLLREGGIAREEIEKTTGPLLEIEKSESLSPGRSLKHYSPTTPLYLTETLAKGRAGLITLCATQEEKEKFSIVKELSVTEDLQEAASRFFSALRELDEAGLDSIVARLLPGKGLGRAMNDRLRRASGSKVVFNEIASLCSQ